MQSQVTYRLLHNYGYKRTLPYGTVVDGPAVFQCQASNLQRPLKEFFRGYYTCYRGRTQIILKQKFKNPSLACNLYIEFT